MPNESPKRDYAGPPLGSLEESAKEQIPESTESQPATEPSKPRKIVVSAPIEQTSFDRKEAEFDRLDRQAQRTTSQIRDAAGMEHHPDDIERREKAAEAKERDQKKSSLGSVIIGSGQSHRSPAQSPTTRSKPGYDNEPDPESHPTSGPPDETDRLIGAEPARAMVEKLETHRIIRQNLEHQNRDHPSEAT